MAAERPAVGIAAATAVSITVFSFLLLSNHFFRLQFFKKMKKSLKNPRDTNRNKGLIAAIGNTPLIRINSLSDATGCQILGKAEFLNPGGSVKDRVAVKIIEEALDSGELVRGGVVTEGSAGSTAISLATVAPAYGCKCHVVIPDDAAIEKEEEKKEEDPQEIVLKVDMHCEGCARKVQKSLKKCEGVEEVKTDSKMRKVVVKGKRADPVKLCERVLKKTGRKAEIISPVLSKPPEEEKKEEAPPPPSPPPEEPKPITVALKIRMHCEACAQVIQKRIKKIEGVETVETDASNELVIVKGFIDPAKLVEDVYRRTRRQASIASEEAEKEEEGEKKEGDQVVEEEEEEEAADAKKLEYWHSKYYYYIDYANNNNIYAYPPPDQVFSDENPNACSVV